jgi:hypothetical protein
VGKAYGPKVEAGEIVDGSGTEGNPWKTLFIREAVLKLILNNVTSCIKRILNWLRDLGFVAEDKYKCDADADAIRVMNRPDHKVIGIY